ncbi:hypothetical protein F5B20DRAFT_534045 [Whalleya microplaca]|nr:hypothetical protein F5B20DRAFT_534045 [Whalleya microplaca]
MPNDIKNRKFGLFQVYPEPYKDEESNKKDVDVIAIHGLDTHSPKTWVAWRKDDDPRSGEVNWLQDDGMLPSVLKNARIFTYDWNANFDNAAENQSLTGHANSLLNKLRIMRNKSLKRRPIIFVASCFGGLLLAKAMHRASHVHSKYLDILYSTFGIVFLGTPFQGSHESFYNATSLRLAVAITMSAETSGGLLSYLRTQRDEDERLEGLFQCFCELIGQLESKIRIVCFYETHRTDFSKILKNLPTKFRKSLKGETSGILVPLHSACLPGYEKLGLGVRHGMLNKYSSSENESFQVVSAKLKEFADEAEEHSRELVSLDGDPIGLRIAQWLKSSPIKVECDEDISALIFKARLLERDSTKTNILAMISAKARDDVSRKIQGLSVALQITSSIAEKPFETSSTISEMKSKTISQIKSQVTDVCESVRDDILLNPAIDLEAAIDDNVTTIIDVKPYIDLRQCVMENSIISEHNELPMTSIGYAYVKGQSGNVTPEQPRFGFYLQNSPVVVDSFPYEPTRGSTDMPPDMMIKTKRMIDRLIHPNRTSNHVLPCIGYIQDRYKKQIQVVFSVDNDYDISGTPVSLHDILPHKTQPSSTHSDVVRVPLGLRLKMAYSLAVAVEGLHLVGWVHEELKSKNVLLLKKNSSNTEGSTSQSSHNDESNLDFSNPYLLGFSWSRHEDAESDLRPDYMEENNAYRHPERWGEPREKFTKVHDVYSLGVIYYEIAHWESISRKFQKLKNEPRLSRDHLKKQILNTVRKGTPHLAGQSFANVIEACLNFDLITKGLDPLQAHSVFKDRILMVLERLARANV